MKHLVVLTGAGISAESGLKTFRDSDGLWEGYEVTEVATPGAFRKNPSLVLDFYNMRRRNVLEAKPNRAHHTLAELEKHFQVSIITQNIDDLHERGGSTRVLHLHGEILKMRSVKNPALIYPIHDDIMLGDTAEDGEQLRPDIVWFEEPVPLMETAAEIVALADIFLVVGTSLVVYPAASLIHYVADSVPVFMVDKKIPVETKNPLYTLIEQPATIGMERVKQILLEQYL